MIISEDEIKKFLSLNLKFEDSSIPKAMKEWNKQDSILEDAKYFSIEDFEIYKNGIDQYLNHKMNKTYLLIWLSIARGALVYSSVNRKDEANNYMYMNLAYKLTEALDGKNDEKNFLSKLNDSKLFIDECIIKNNNLKN